MSSLLSTRCLVGVIALLLLPAASVGAEGPLTDPVDIFYRHYEAVGGIDRLRAITTAYSEGTIVYDGLQGTFRRWERFPLQYRFEEDYAVIRQTSGDDGTHAWSQDTNGKTLVLKDRDTGIRRALSYHLENFAHLDPGAGIFVLTFGGVSRIKGADCYAVHMTNRLNGDAAIYFFAADTLRLVRSRSIQPDVDIVTDYSDFRTVAGVVLPFRETSVIEPMGKTITAQTTRLQVNAAVAPGRFQVPDPDAPAVLFDTDGGAEDIPFQFVENNIFLQVRVGDSDAMWMLDSGASMSVIDRAYAAALGLTSRGRIKGHGFGGGFELSFVDLPAYQIGGVTVEPQTVLSYDGLADNFYEPRIAGILGFDFLSRVTTRIDYDHERLSFYDPRHFDYQGTGAVIDAPIKYNTFCVPAVVDEKYAGLWSIDLGAFNTSFHYGAATRHGLANRRGIVRFSRGMAAHYKEKTIRFNTFRIGSHLVRKPLVSVPLHSDSGAGSRNETIGNIGNSLLRRFVVYLDYHRQQIILEKGALFDQPASADCSGLQVGRSAAGPPMVVWVTPDTPAAAAGIQPGDLILAIDGNPLESKNAVRTIDRLMRGEAGTVYALRLRRGETVFTKTLKLRPLLE